MIIFESINSKNIDEFAEWLNEHGKQDFAPWDIWFENKYCRQCEAEEVYDVDRDFYNDYGWCEITGKCKFFQDMDEISYGKQIIKMWLESEV